jgi:hypothetical protein
MPSEGMKESAGNYDALQRMPEVGLAHARMKVLAFALDPYPERIFMLIQREWRCGSVVARSRLGGNYRDP